VPDADRVMRLARLADLLDSRWRIPGTRIRFGLDGIASLVPVAGDTLTALWSAWMVIEARRMGAPTSLVARMVGNLALDWAVGSIPVVGTISDVAFKANRRNVKLLTDHFLGMR
jgi:hypothetical protein